MHSRFLRRSGAALSLLALCGGLSGAALAATAGSASAQQNSDIIPISSGLRLDVSGQASWAGAPVIQWDANGQANQKWEVPPIGAAPNLIQNANSKMCLTTDGVAGDQLYQEPCVYSPYEDWVLQDNSQGDAVNGDQAVTIYNPAFNLVVDVYGNSYTEGAAIDAWPANGQFNQAFWGPDCQSWCS